MLFPARLTTPASGKDIEWQENPHAAQWDSALAKLGGHPLQSALWGDARRVVDGIRDHRWLATCRGVPFWMIRLEERRIPLLGRIAWAPKGPAGEWSPGGEFLPPALVERLRALSVVAMISDPWMDVIGTARNLSADSDLRPKTIWIDLSAGQDCLWRNLDKQWRYGVGRAERLGVTIESTVSAFDIEAFFALCADVSQSKGFRLPGSIGLMKRLLCRANDSVEARLLVARHEGRLGAGVFLVRCGMSVHYFWGAVDRALSRHRVGEAVQWAAIEWALAKRCRRYDLEGIDPQRNPGVYEFKKKMGGREVTLAGRQRFPLGLRGKLVNWLDTHLH